MTEADAPGAIAMPDMIYGMGMTQFIRFLRRECVDKISGNADDRPYLQGKDEAYRQVITLIDVFMKSYAEQKTLTKQSQNAFMESIASDRRRQFDNPYALVDHIRTIAGKPPFFDSERISLAAIFGFANDFLYAHEDKVKQQALKNAAF